jgi:chemotaxis protein methyltransferase CheR
MCAAMAEVAAGRARPGGREFDLTDADFRRIRDLVQDVSGIVLADIKRDLVYGRLAPRLRKLGYRSFADYLKCLEGPDGHDEQIALLNALTTNLTGFFREKHHFDRLAGEFLPRLMQEKRDRRLRIWSAGCSSGQEPYTIAMVMRRVVTDLARWDALILATDIDSNMVAQAREGSYDESVAESIPPDYRRFTETGEDGRIAMADSLKSLIRFRRLNLIGEWPMAGPFDAIFCRNVVIYFDKDTQRVLFDRYANMLRPGGWLFIGHSETLHRVSDRFTHLGQTTYQKIA